MKNLMILISLVTLFTACSKSNDEAPGPGKDNPAEIKIKGKVWVGTFTYTGKATEYYTIQFKPDNTLIWSEYTADYTGKWTVEGNQVNITFIGKQFSADISTDDELVNITYGAVNGWVINSGKLCPDANMVLENTVWKGALPDPQGPHLMALPDLVILSFKAGLNVDFQDLPLKYTRSGASIRLKPYNIYPAWFGIITPDGKKIKGTNLNNGTWYATKQ